MKSSAGIAAIVSLDVVPREPSSTDTFAIVVSSGASTMLTKSNRPRGLCWSCYYRPGVREQYPSTSKFARRSVSDFNGQASQAADVTAASLGYQQDSTLFYPIVLYQQGFRFFNMGYAACMSIVLLIVSLAVTLLILRSSRRWVHYAGGGR